MKIPPEYNFNSNIVSSLQKIEANRQIIAIFAKKHALEKSKFLQNAVFKRAFYTLCLEGEKISYIKYSLENLASVQNTKIWNALNIYKWIKDGFVYKKKLTLGDLLYLHKLLMQGSARVKEAGVFRKVQELSIIDFTKEGVYAFTPPGEIEAHIDKLISFINSDLEIFIPIKASLALYIFMRISPFLEGNGLVGRLLFFLVFTRDNYLFENALVVEEYLYRVKEEYFHILNDEKDAGRFLEFMLNIISKASSQLRLILTEKAERVLPDELLPRRKKILDYILEKGTVSLSELKENNTEVSGRMLRYDLANLMENKFILKRGNTRAVVYSARE